MIYARALPCNMYIGVQLAVSHMLKDEIDLKCKARLTKYKQTAVCVFQNYLARIVFIVSDLG